MTGPSRSCCAEHHWILMGPRQNWSGGPCKPSSGLRRGGPLKPGFGFGRAVSHLATPSTPTQSPPAHRIPWSTGGNCYPPSPQTLAGQFSPQETNQHTASQVRMRVVDCPKSRRAMSRHSFPVLLGPLSIEKARPNLVYEFRSRSREVPDHTSKFQPREHIFGPA